jgi:diaminopimelate decarboxylase
MDHFTYRQGTLHCESVPLARVAEAVGTPTYVYSRAAVLAAYRAYDHAFRDVPHLICYAVKANSNLALLHALAQVGAGADVVSGGELYRALRAGVPARRIVFSGVGKTREEMREALKADILMFNVESVSELRALDEVARGLGARAPISLRVNPDVDPETHPYIATGLRTSKFGIPIGEAPAVYQEAARRAGIEVVGVQMHIGSQLTKTAPFADAAARVVALAQDLRARGIRLRYLDLGGGLGIRYRDEQPPSPEHLARALLPLVRALDVTVVLEPGRSIVGNAGVLLTRVLYRKDTGAKRFVVVDAAMNDLVRPAMYNAHHEIRPVAEPDGAGQETVDVVGPICESGDFLARDRAMPRVEEGALLAVMSAGAYGFVMASNYNDRPRAAAVLVDGDRYTIVRRRETYEDLVAGETLP